MTKEELDTIKARTEAASKPPWVLHCFSTPYLILAPQEGEEPWDQRVVDGKNMRANGLFIVHARTDIPKLLDEVERLQDVCNAKNFVFAEAVGILKKNRTMLKWQDSDPGYIIEAWSKGSEGEEALDGTQSTEG